MNDLCKAKPWDFHSQMNRNQWSGMEYKKPILKLRYSRLKNGLQWLKEYANYSQWCKTETATCMVMCKCCNKALNVSITAFLHCGPLACPHYRLQHSIRLPPWPNSWVRRCVLLSLAVLDAVAIVNPSVCWIWWCIQILMRSCSGAAQGAVLWMSVLCETQQGAQGNRRIPAALKKDKDTSFVMWLFLHVG